MSVFKYPCGCEFEVLEEYKDGKFPRLKFDYYKDFNRDCSEVWKLFGLGLNLGVFQLDSPLGIKSTKELKPTTISHLAALNSILRPGALGNRDENGISVTQHYINRKNGTEEILYPIKALEPILKDTYGLCIFQEQSIRMGIDIAGMSLSEADYYLRKGIGTKNAKILFAAEEKFVEGATKLGKVTREEAKSIFDGIKASARYQFNSAHAVSYAIHSHTEMLLKAHFPLHFYTSKLKSPRNSQTRDDNANFIYEAKLFNIDTKLPTIKHLRPEFYNDGKSIYFGLTNIKGVGQSHFASLCEVIKGNYGGFTGNFFEFAINSARYLSPSVVSLLIEAGACDFFGLARQQMLEEFKLVAGLTMKEKDYLFKYLDATKAGLLKEEK